MSPGVAYTIASGKLFCPISEFYEEAERLLERPVWNFEFANQKAWDALRERAEEELAELVGAG